MIDALLYAFRDGIRATMNYGYAECEIMDDGRPPPRCGNVFVSIHGGRSRAGPSNQRNLDELFGFSLTLTMRVTVPLDKVGREQIARNLALVPLAQRQGFNAKLEQLRVYCHSNWARVVQTSQTPNSANDNITAWATGTVYGFVEPPRYQGPEVVKLVGGEWFAADPEAEEFGIVSELKFDNARRMQPQITASGSGSFT